MATTAEASADESHRALAGSSAFDLLASPENQRARDYYRALLKTSGAVVLLNETAAATGFSRKQVAEFAQASWRELSASADMIIGDHDSLARALLAPRSATSPWAVMSLVGPLSAPRTWAVMVDPLSALLQFLERLVRLGRRADVARQLAVQRHQLARHAVATATDRPPGEVVVSSARVPRGPDFSRVALTQTVEATRGRLLVVA